MGSDLAAGATCQVRTTGALFGAFNQASGSTTGTVARVSVTCTSPTPARVAYKVIVPRGREGSAGRRWMSYGRDRLAYQLYTDASRSRIWGDGSGSSFAISDTMHVNASTTTKAYPIYATLSFSKTAPAGSYYDLLLVQLVYR